MKRINLDKVCEGIDYELVPVEDHPNDYAWEIRILKGEFVESIIRYGNISFDGTRDCLTFNFKVVYSPSEATESDVKLQEFAGDILEDILDTAIAEGWLVHQEK